MGLRFRSIIISVLDTVAARAIIVGRNRPVSLEAKHLLYFEESIGGTSQYGTPTFKLRSKPPPNFQLSECPIIADAPKLEKIEYGVLRSLESRLPDVVSTLTSNWTLAYKNYYIV